MSPFEEATVTYHTMTNQNHQQCDAMLQTTQCGGVRCQNSITSMQMDDDVGSPVSQSVVEPPVIG